MKKRISCLLLAAALGAMFSAPSWALQSTDDSQITGQWNFVTPPKIRTDIITGAQEFRSPSYVIKSDSTTYTATNTTTDGISVTVLPWTMTPGKSLRITVSGNITGANAAKSVKLYLDDAAIVTLTTASGTTGNYVAQFIVMSTGAATQNLNGWLASNSVAPLVVIATDTTAWNTAPRVVKVQLTSGNAGDSVTATTQIVELLP
jgi:hypothetical protein